MGGYSLVAEANHQVDLTRFRLGDILWSKLKLDFAMRFRCIEFMRHSVCNVRAFFQVSWVRAEGP